MVHGTRFSILNGLVLNFAQFDKLGRTSTTKCQLDKGNQAGYLIKSKTRLCHQSTLFQIKCCKSMFRESLVTEPIQKQKQLESVSAYNHNTKFET